MRSAFEIDFLKTYAENYEEQIKQLLRRHFDEIMSQFDQMSYQTPINYEFAQRVFKSLYSISRNYYEVKELIYRRKWQEEEKKEDSVQK